MAAILSLFFKDINPEEEPAPFEGLLRFELILFY
jgi:hypothetical protein